MSEVFTSTAALALKETLRAIDTDDHGCAGNGCHLSLHSGAGPARGCETRIGGPWTT